MSTAVTVETIFEWAVQTGFMVALLLAFVLIIRRRVAKAFGAKAAYALWLLPLARLVMPNITLPRLASSPSQITDVPVLSVEAIASVPINILSQPVSAESSVNWTPVLLGIWAAGVVVSILFHVFMQRRMNQSLNENSVQVDPQIVSQVEHCAAKLGLKNVPDIRQLKDNIGPMVCHIFNPVIYLPQDFQKNFTTDQQTYVLLHELAHIKRRDLWAAWAGLAVQSVNWPNPLVHMALRKFRSDQEAACDVTVLECTQTQTDNNKIAAYAETLLQAAKVASQNENFKSFGGATPIKSHVALTIHQPLKERLLMLKNPPKPLGAPARALLTALAVSAVALTAPLSFADQNPEKDELAGKAHATTKSKSVMKFVTKNDDGEDVKKHFEISVNNGDVEAYEIDYLGQKTKIDIKDIEGFDLGEGIMKDIDVQAFALGMLDGQHLDGQLPKEMKIKIMKDLETALPDGKKVKIIRKLTGDNSFTFKSDDGDNSVMVFPATPMPPNFPEGFDAIDVPLKARLNSAGSLLKAAEQMIREAEGEGADLTVAKLELEDAIRALRDAEKALQDK